MSSISDRLLSALGGSYTIERELSGGGMAHVFVAEDHDLGRKVVIKILPPELAASVSAERFRREILTVARLQHPHIVPILKAGELDGLPYFVMPYVDGESIDIRLRRSRTLGVRETLGIMKDVARALAFAHEHDVVHRDIKPGNVLPGRRFRDRDGLRRREGAVVRAQVRREGRRAHEHGDVARHHSLHGAGTGGR